MLNAIQEVYSEGHEQTSNKAQSFFFPLQQRVPSSLFKDAGKSRETAFGTYSLSECLCDVSSSSVSLLMVIDLAVHPRTQDVH